CKRSGRTRFSSQDVAIALGAALQPGSAGVDLTHPEAVCRIDIHDNLVKLYIDETPGPGGFPIGTQGRAVALISGGIDSPVAAWFGLKRGLEVHYLFCNLGGPLQLWGPIAAARHLAMQWSYGYRPILHIADFNALIQAFAPLNHRYRTILLKRYFYRAADRLARRIGAQAIITGEALGQVSSQTLSNLNTISQVTNRLIIRPLVAFDKIEIIAQARSIGTLPISEQVPEFCNVAGTKPRTRSSGAVLDNLEKAVDPIIAESAISNWTSLDLKNLPEPIKPDDPVLDERPAGACLVWLDNPELSAPVPPDADAVVDILSLRSFITGYRRTGVLLFECVQGIMSRDAALAAREKGLDAYRYHRPG
ncbi:tRNA 4-thiouridine(8) synthase ThiI, partial [bacterium]|nr:tRNA 4-thiouridine(8) synthase ThiI [candidate division CSSED10-310 bacterium]